MSEFGREPTPEELAKKLTPVEKVRKVLKIAKEPVVRNSVGDEEDSSLGDFIEDKNALQRTAIQSIWAGPQQRY